METKALEFFIACATAAGFGIAIAAFGSVLPRVLDYDRPLRALPEIQSLRVKLPSP